MYVGRHDLRLEYRPRVRRGVPYMYVGYLATWLWPGQVTETGNAAEVQYAGRSWTLTAGRRTAVCAGRACEFRHAPLLEYGRLYLPPDMFHSITGWHMDYRSQRHSDEIHLYTDAGQAPSQPPT